MYMYTVFVQPVVQFDNLLAKDKNIHVQRKKAKIGSDYYLFTYSLH